MPPRFSIIVPFQMDAKGERSATLAQLLASVPNRSDIEVLVVVDDAGAPPSFLAGLPPLCTGTVVPNTRKKGSAGSARNTGLAVAQGDWVLFADHDEVFTPLMGTILEQVEDTQDLWIHNVGSIQDEGKDGKAHQHVMGCIARYDTSGNPYDLWEHTTLDGRIMSKAHLERNGLKFAARPCSSAIEFTAALTLSTDRIGRIPLVGTLLGKGGKPRDKGKGLSVVAHRIVAVARRNRMARMYGQPQLQKPLLPVAVAYGNIRHPKATIKSDKKGWLDGSPLTKTWLNRHHYTTRHTAGPVARVWARGWGVLHADEAERLRWLALWEPVLLKGEEPWAQTPPPPPNRPNARHDPNTWAMRVTTRNQARSMEAFLARVAPLPAIALFAPDDLLAGTSGNRSHPTPKPTARHNRLAEGLLDNRKGLRNPLRAHTVLAQLLAWREELQRHKAHWWLTANDHSADHRLAMAAAWNEGMGIAHLQHASISPYRYHALTGDVVLLDGQAALDAYALCPRLASALPTAPQVFLTGYLKGKVTTPPPGTRTLGVSLNDTDEVNALLDSARTAQEEGWTVVVRPHPRQPARTSAAAKATAEHHGWGWSTPQDETPEDFLARIDGLLAGDSGFLLEAALAGRQAFYHHTSSLTPYDAFGYVARGVATDVQHQGFQGATPTTESLQAYDKGYGQAKSEVFGPICAALARHHT